MSFFDGTVSLALVGLLSYVLKDMAKTLKDLKGSVDKSTKVNEEHLKFMRRLNGSLKSAVESKKK